MWSQVLGHQVATLIVVAGCVTLAPAAALTPHAQASPSAGAVCNSAFNCSLNGICTSSGTCQCDLPWTGPRCGVLAYATTPASGRSLFPNITRGNTWNGAILQDTDGKYHLYNPLYPSDSLGGAKVLMHGVADQVAGPYDWSKYPDISIPTLGPFDGPKSVVFTDSVANKTQYSLWFGGNVYLSDSAAGPFSVVDGFRYTGHNPAPIYHNGSFYNIVAMTSGVYTTPRLEAGATWTKYGDINTAVVPVNWIPEDPDMWVDKRGNWHIVNHAYSEHEYTNCSTSLLSTHFFSQDGKDWHFLPQAVQPYSHTVPYNDGSSHMFITMERPNLYFDRTGQLTHIHLAADGVTGDEGCGNRTAHAHFGHTPCDNCKYGDHGTTTIIALNVG